MGLLKPRTAEKLIFHGDDMERLTELRNAVVRAEAAKVRAEDEAERASRGPRRAGDDLPDISAAVEAYLAAQAAYDEATDEAAERAVEVRLSAIGSRRFRELLAQHPAREDDDIDAEYGVNMETFPRALLAFRDGETRTIVDPDVSEADLGEFLDDECSDGDFEELWVLAFWLNKAQGVDPRLGKSSRATLTSTSS